MILLTAETGTREDVAEATRRVTLAVEVVESFRSTERARGNATTTSARGLCTILGRCFIVYRFLGVVMICQSHPPVRELKNCHLPFWIGDLIR
jgi:hypothetical protein